MRIIYNDSYSTSVQAEVTGQIVWPTDPRSLSGLFYVGWTTSSSGRIYIDGNNYSLGRFDRGYYASVTTPSYYMLGGDFVSIYCNGPDVPISANWVSYLELPNVSVISSSAFYSWSRLRSVSLPSLNYVPDYAFCSCNYLKSVNVGSPAWIGTSAFYGCISLYSVNNLSTAVIGDRAFYNCDLFSLSLTGCLYIGDEAFRLNGFFSVLTLDTSSVCSLGSDVFRECRYFTRPYSGRIQVRPSLVDAYKASPYWESVSDIIYPISS